MDVEGIAPHRVGDRVMPWNEIDSLRCVETRVVRAICESRFSPRFRGSETTIAGTARALFVVFESFGLA